MKHSSFFPVIPARSGSSGVKHKNIEILGSLPLFLHSVSFAYQNFGQCCFTSDSSNYFNMYRDFFELEADWKDCSEDSISEIGPRIYFHKRNPVDAQTLSPVDQVLYKLAVDTFLPEETQYLLMLQPTSPFRWSAEIRDLKLLAELDHWTSIFSVRHVGGNHPNRMYLKDNLNFGEVYDKSLSQDNIPRQKLNDLYIKDGAYYLFRVSNLRREEFIGARPLLFLRDQWPFINIDTLDDMKLAKLLWSQRDT